MHTGIAVMWGAMAALGYLNGLSFAPVMSTCAAIAFATLAVFGWKRTWRQPTRGQFKRLHSALAAELAEMRTRNLEMRTRNLEMRTRNLFVQQTRAMANRERLVRSLRNNTEYYLLNSPRWRRMSANREDGELYTFRSSEFPTLRLRREGRRLFRELAEPDIHALLLVTCPSTKKTHILFVPNTMTDVREARAWTFGKTKDEFRPVRET